MPVLLGQRWETWKKGRPSLPAARGESIWGETRLAGRGPEAEKVCVEEAVLSASWGRWRLLTWGH